MRLRLVRTHHRGSLQEAIDEIEELKLELELCRKRSIGRRRVMRDLGFRVRALTETLEDRDATISTLTQELEDMRATCRRQASELDSGDEDITQEIRRVKAPALEIDLARMEIVSKVAPIALAPSPTPLGKLASATSVPDLLRQGWGSSSVVSLMDRRNPQ